MDDEYIPFVEQSRYGAFLCIIKRDFPHAYNEWPKTHAEWLKLHEREKKPRDEIHTVRCIKVCPDEFAEFCHRYGHKGTRQDLLRFAITIAKAEPQRVISGEGESFR